MRSTQSCFQRFNSQRAILTFGFPSLIVFFEKLSRSTPKLSFDVRYKNSGLFCCSLTTLKGCFKLPVQPLSILSPLICWLLLPFFLRCLCLKTVSEVVSCAYGSSIVESGRKSGCAVFYVFASGVERRIYDVEVKKVE